MDKRTLQQNNSLHLYLQLLSEALNNAGLDIRRTLKEDFEIPWTPELAKQYLWKPLQNAMLEKESTTQLTRKEVNQVYEVLTKHLSERFGLEAVEFPHLESNEEIKEHLKKEL